jgi:ribosomal protein L44E
MVVARKVAKEKIRKRKEMNEKRRRRRRRRCGIGGSARVSLIDDE